MLNLIFWIFVFVLGCSFFGISIKAIIESPAGQANFGYLLYLLSLLWQWFLAHVTTLISTFRF
jgi:hypothetical protein